MFGYYDNWKLATPPEYDEPWRPEQEGPHQPIHEEPFEDEPKPLTHRFIELDDRNDPPILE